VQISVASLPLRLASHGTTPAGAHTSAPIRMLSRSARSSAPGGDCLWLFRRGNHRGFVPGGKAGPISIDKDEHPRPETTLEV